MTSRNKNLNFPLARGVLLLVLPLGVSAEEPTATGTGADQAGWLGSITTAINTGAIYIGWLIEYIASRVLYIAAMFSTFLWTTAFLDLTISQTCLQLGSCGKSQETFAISFLFS